MANPKTIRARLYLYDFDKMDAQELQGFRDWVDHLMHLKALNKAKVNSRYTVTLYKPKS